jgi:hypothetical protein
MAWPRETCLPCPFKKNKSGRSAEIQRVICWGPHVDVNPVKPETLKKVVSSLLLGFIKWELIRFTFRVFE